MASDKKTATTIVIGTGISGLYCAYYLKKQGVDVMMVDANNWVGGRIKPLKGWVPWKTLDLGAEFIHGKESLLNELTNAEGFPCRLMFTWAQGDGEHPEELFGKEYAMYYLAKEKKLLPYDTDHPDIAKTNEVLFGISDAETNPNDKRTLEDYLKEKGVSPTGLKLADAGYSNSLCCVSKRMSFYETVKLNQEWDKFGHGDYRLENSMGELVDFLANGIPIKLSWPVKSINYNGKVIELVNYKGEKVYAPKVVVTVPLTILQQELITFNPPLPPPKQKAIKSLKMENAIKIVLEFSERFWPSRLGGIVCVDTLIPEMWFECPDRVGELTPQSKKVNRPAPAKPTYLISAFACADFANKVTSMSEEQIRLAVIAQIDEMFGNNKAFTYYGKEEATEKTNVPKPATTFYLRFLFQDWAKEPWARGGYTHPAIHSSEKVRSDLAATLDNKLFFAGEHTHPKAYMTMHGAIDTGDIAAKRVLESLAQEKTQAKL